MGKDLHMTVPSILDYLMDLRCAREDYVMRVFHGVATQKHHRAARSKRLGRADAYVKRLLWELF